MLKMLNIQNIQNNFCQCEGTNVVSTICGGMLDKLHDVTSRQHILHLSSTIMSIKYDDAVIHFCTICTITNNPNLPIRRKECCFRQSWRHATQISHHASPRLFYLRYFLFFYFVFLFTSRHLFFLNYIIPFQFLSSSYSHPFFPNPCL